MLFTPLINVAIVDDHTLFRKTLKSYLSDQGNMNIVIQSSDLSDFINQLHRFTLDILLISLFKQGLEVNDHLKAVKERYPNIKILVLSMNTDPDLISELLDIGIDGCISKTDEPEELIRAIQSITNGGIYRNCLFTEALYRDKQNKFKNGKDDPTVSLNDREKKILLLLWEEKTNKEIADELFLGVRSIEKIRQDLKEKTGAKSTIGLLKYAINKKILPNNARTLAWGFNRHS